MAKKVTKKGRAGAAYYKPRPTVVLLEVNSEWIKLLEIESNKKGLKIVRAFLDPVDSETVVSESLRKAFSEQRFSKLPLVCSMPRQLVNVRLLELPSIEYEEIADMVALQVSRQTPYSLDEILSGFKLVGQTRQGTYTRVLLAFVQRSAVRERYHALEDAGLEIERMGVSSEGVINWLLHYIQSEPAEKVTVSLDVNSYYTQMLVVRRQKVIFTKSLLWGADQLSQGGEGFAGRVKDALRSCEDVLQGQAVDQVIVSGAGLVRSAEMLASMEEQLGIPCRGVDVLEGLAISPAAASILTDEVKQRVSLTGLVGMAQAPDSLALHFVPDVYAMRKGIQRMGRVWAGIICGLAAFLVAGSFYLTLSAWTRIQQLQVLETEAALYRPKVTEIERMVEVIRATHTRLGAQAIPENLLPALHAAVPDGVFLGALSFEVQAGRFNVSGSSPTRSDIRDFISHLEEVPYFQGVEEAGGTAMDDSGRFSFQINGGIRGMQ
jgi:Tfp pilus assembly protein PilN